jgi:hypothetical protein
VIAVEGVTEEQLAGEHAARPLGHLQLDVLTGLGGSTLGLHGQHVPFHVQLDRVRRHPGEVEGDHELVAVAVGVHRHGCRSAPRSRRVAEDLLGQAVQLTKRVGAHQHRRSTPFMIDIGLRCTRSGSGIRGLSPIPATVTRDFLRRNLSLP